MTAVLIPTSSEAEWLAARRKGVTASEVAILLGLSPYGSPFALYHQKRGDLPDQEDNMAMAIGRHFEDFVAGQFAELHPEFALMGSGRELFAHPDRPWQLATPDRFVSEALECPPSKTAYGTPLAVLECKTDGGFDGWGEDGTDEIPVHYRCQLLWQMDVVGVGTGYLACLFMNRRQLRVYELTMDDAAQADLALMETEAERFLERIDRGDPPDVDWRPATSAALKTLHPDVEDRDVYISHQRAKWYHAACRNLKTAEQTKRLHENRLRDRLGNGHRLIDNVTGEVIARRDVYDVKEHTRRASHVDKLVPVKPKEPR
jgi:putative phage-type endonuclease